MENKIRDKYLPIGTVVKLIGGKAVLMITGYCIETKGKIMGIKGEIENKKGKYFDYCACPYPSGIMNSDVNIVFNHENIEAVIFTGFETELHEKYSEFLKQEMAKMDKKEENE